MSTHAPPSTDQVRTAWESIADGFDRWVTPQTEHLGRRLLADLDVGPGVRVLDVGAGSGAIARPAAALGATVHAIDLAPTMLERLAARARDQGLDGIETSTMDARDLVFDDDTFDVACSLNGVTMVPDFPRGLREMVRVTRPGGRILVASLVPPDTEFIAWSLGAMRATVPGFEPPLDPPPPPWQLADSDVFTNHLQQAGAHDVQVTPLQGQTTFDSAGHLWDSFTSSNPIGAQLAGGLDDDARTDVLQVLDGMLRERSGGTPGATLAVRLQVGIGTA